MENWNPIQDLGPPRKLSVCAQIPGMLVTLSGNDPHRSGLRFGLLISTVSSDARDSYLNSNASSPQISVDRFISRIGILTWSPFEILMTRTECGLKLRDEKETYRTEPPSSKGITSSLIASLSLVGTGACMRITSFNTQSR